jgi:hypothetical protein
MSSQEICRNLNAFGSADLMDEEKKKYIIGKEIMLVQKRKGEDVPKEILEADADTRIVTVKMVLGSKQTFSFDFFDEQEFLVKSTKTEYEGDTKNDKYLLDESKDSFQNLLAKKVQNYLREISPQEHPLEYHYRQQRLQSSSQPGGCRDIGTHEEEFAENLSKLVDEILDIYGKEHWDSRYGYDSDLEKEEDSESTVNWDTLPISSRMIYASCVGAQSRGCFAESDFENANLHNIIFSEDWKKKNHFGGSDYQNEIGLMKPKKIIGCVVVSEESDPVVLDQEKNKCSFDKTCGRVYHYNKSSSGKIELLEDFHTTSRDYPWLN